MTQVSNFTKNQLRNYTYLELMQTIVERLTAATGAVTNQKAVDAITDFRSKVSAMDAAYKAASSSPLTAPLAEADRLRDNAYGTISQVVKAMLTSGIASLETAAADLKTVLDTFRVSTSAQYNEESGAILQLCQEMDSHTASLTALNLTAVYAELKTQNTAVRTLLMQRNAAQANDQTAVMKTHRAIVDSAFDTLRAHLNALLVLDTTTALESLASLLNADINYVRQHSGQGTSTTDVVSGDQSPEDSNPGGSENPNPGGQNPPVLEA